MHFRPCDVTAGAEVECVPPQASLLSLLVTPSAQEGPSQQPHQVVEDARSLIDDGCIRLRPLAVTDTQAHVAGCDQLIIDRLGGGEASSAERVEEWLARNASAWVSCAEVVDLGVEDIETGELAGCVGIQRGLDYLTVGQVNVTYAVYPQWRGRGYATRAVALAMQLEADRRDTLTFVIRVAPDNPDSIAVARRAGFLPAGRTDDENGHLLWFHRPVHTHA